MKIGNKVRVIDDKEESYNWGIGEVVGSCRSVRTIRFNNKIIKNFGCIQLHDVTSVIKGIK